MTPAKMLGKTRIKVNGYQNSVGVQEVKNILDTILIQYNILYLTVVVG